MEEGPPEPPCRWSLKKEFSDLKQGDAIFSPMFSETKYDMK
jgi:hypothetical protein